MLDWLKTILGDAYTEEIGKKVSEEIGKAFVSKADFNTAKADLNTAKETIKERDQQLTDLKKSTGDAKELEKQIEKLQADNKAKDEAHEKEMTQIKLTNAIDKTLSDAKAKNPNAVKGVISDFLNKAELADDGTVKGLKEELERLSKDDGTSFLFNLEDTSKPIIKGATPAGTSSTPPDPKVQGFETKLAEARKTGDTAAVVAIKREAFEEGVVLL